MGLASLRRKPRLPIRREIYTRPPDLCKASP
ncbi:prevent-host-death protein, partial [Thermus thermophilus]|nr:prevent-host-death protein [Thermus thermophilus]